MLFQPNLLDTLCFFCLSVDVCFQKFVFLLFLEETEIAFAFNFLLGKYM